MGLGARNRQRPRRSSDHCRRLSRTRLHRSLARRDPGISAPGPARRESFRHDSRLTRSRGYDDRQGSRQAGVERRTADRHRYRRQPGRRRGRALSLRVSVHDTRNVSVGGRAVRDLSQGSPGVRTEAGDHAHARYRRRQATVLLSHEGREPVPGMARHPLHAGSTRHLPAAASGDASRQRRLEQPAHHVSHDRAGRRDQSGPAGGRPGAPRTWRGGIRVPCSVDRRHAGGAFDAVFHSRAFPPCGFLLDRHQRPHPIPAGSGQEQSQCCAPCTTIWTRRSSGRCTP